MFSAQGITIQFGARTLFSDLSFTLVPKDRVAFAGPNGAGKSTLMKIIAGIATPDAGKIVKSKATDVGYLPQEGVHARGRTLYAEAETAFADALKLQEALEECGQQLEALDTSSDEYATALEDYGELQLRLEHHDVSRMRPRIESVLAGLGFKRGDLEREVGEFSGGWQMRIALAKLLLSEPSVLLLDEPTNHLDIETVQWLESYLRGYPGAIILISHDKALLDALIKRTFAFEHGDVQEYAGNYSFYLTERVARKERLVRAFKNQQREIDRQQRLIDRFRAKASKASMVQSRIKQLDKIERIELEEDASEISFKFPQPKPSGHAVVTLEGVEKSYGPIQVFKGLDLRIERGDRIAIVGVNGAGKSTFSRIISGEEPIGSGERKVGHNVSIAHFAQNHADHLDPKRTVLQTAEEGAGSANTQQLRTLLGCFLFRGDDVFKPVGVLSGGERSRLALTKMLLRPANFIILDEPTNHLDMQSQDVLQHALEGFEGTYAIVSHNRSFLDPIVNKVIEFLPGQPPRVFLGNVTYYLEKKAEEAEAAAKAAAGNAAVATGRGKGAAAPAPADARNRREQRQIEARLRQERAKALKPLEAELEAVEQRIANHEARREEISAQLADPNFYADSEKVQAASAEFAALESDLAAAYSKWDEVSTKLERATAKFDAEG